MTDINKILFYDIETHIKENYSELPIALQKAWINHYHDEDTFGSSYVSSYVEQAGLYPEFSTVICISFGCLTPTGFITKSLLGKDEKQILNQFRLVLDRFASNGYVLAGWNSNVFDQPYLSVRYMLNDLIVPKPLNSVGLKPWEISNIDVMNLYKLGRYRATSLEAACAAFNIPCKSTEVTGRNMYMIHFDEINWDEMKEYCEEDVICTYKVYEKLIKYLR